MANESVKNLLLSASAVLMQNANSLRLMGKAQRSPADRDDMFETANDRVTQAGELALLANMYGPVLQDLVELRGKQANHVAVMSEMQTSKLDGSAIDVIFSRHEFTLEKVAPNLKLVGPEGC